MLNTSAHWKQQLSWVLIEETRQIKDYSMAQSEMSQLSHSSQGAMEIHKDQAHIRNHL